MCHAVTFPLDIDMKHFVLKGKSMTIKKHFMRKERNHLANNKLR